MPLIAGFALCFQYPFMYGVDRSFDGGSCGGFLDFLYHQCLGFDYFFGKTGIGIPSVQKVLLRFIESILAAAVMGCAVYGVRLLVDDLFCRCVRKLVTVFVPTLSGLLVYFVVTLVLRIDEGRLPYHW